jgi:hypothetical protein
MCIVQVLIHGTEEATIALAEHCTSTNAVQGQVFTPSVGDIIDATTERHIYQVGTSILEKLCKMILTPETPHSTSATTACIWYVYA